MLFEIHKVYTIYDYGPEGQMILEIEKDEPEQVDITAGRRNELLGVVEGSKADYTEQPIKLIDDNNALRFSVNIEQPSAVYIYMECGYILDQISITLESIDQDVLLEEFSHDSRLIFCFFANENGQLTIRGRKSLDNAVRRRLLQSPKDIFLRRVLIERMSLDYKMKQLENKEFLTVEDVANHLGLVKRTIQNKVSNHELPPPLNIAGTRVWDKKKLFEWFREQEEWILTKIWQLSNKIHENSWRYMISNLVYLL